MSDMTRILEQIGSGDASASARLLQEVYGELRRLAGHKLARERGEQTLQATALVHEAYLRLIGAESPQWHGRAHFFAAAAEAMRRILVEAARRKHGGELRRVDLDLQCLVEEGPSVDVLALDIALEKLSRKDPQKAQVVKLRFFAGLTMPLVAEALDISLATADAIGPSRSWLYAELDESG